jgi:hypothetical protein
VLCPHGYDAAHKDLSGSWGRVADQRLPAPAGESKQELTLAAIEREVSGVIRCVIAKISIDPASGWSRAYRLACRIRSASLSVANRAASICTQRLPKR